MYKTNACHTGTRFVAELESTSTTSIAARRLLIRYRTTIVFHRYLKKVKGVQTRLEMVNVKMFWHVVFIAKRTDKLQKCRASKVIIQKATKIFLVSSCCFVHLVITATDLRLHLLP